MKPTSMTGLFKASTKHKVIVIAKETQKAIKDFVPQQQKEATSVPSDHFEEEVNLQPKIN